MSTGFWERVDRRSSDECWEWKGHRIPTGYGQITQRGRRTSTHRRAWELARGPIPEGLCVLHRCDNPPCCNPAHLWLGTQADNSADRDRKGRAAVGEGNGKSRLTRDDVLAIHLLVSYGLSWSKAARSFGVSKGTVAAIISGRTWRHV
jgi:hypothetical protein